MRADSVLIVGGGIAGGTLAVTLLERGVEVELVEIEEVWRPIGAGLTLIGPALRALETIGLVDEVVAAAVPVNRRAVGDAAGKLGEPEDLPRFLGPEYPAFVQMARPALHGLLSRLARERGLHVRTGLTVDSLENTGDAVEVELSDGSRGSYDLVVGADGIKSRVRELVFDPLLRPQPTGQAIWRAMIRVDGELPPQLRETFATYHGRDRKVVLVNTTGGQLYMGLVQNDPPDRWVEDEELPELMRAELAEYSGFVGELRDRIVAPEQIVYRLLESVLVPPPWYRGRVVLIGDAAHAVTPHMAFGAGLAIEDVVVLAEELEGGGSVDEALERFMERRWDRVRYVSESSLQYGRWELSADDHEADEAGLRAQSAVKLAEPI